MRIKSAQNLQYGNDFEDLDSSEDIGSLSEQPEPYDDRDIGRDDDKDFFNEDFDFNDDVGGLAPTMEKHNDLLRELTDFRPFLRDLAIKWLALEWDEDTSSWQPQKDIPPMCNRRCVRWCMAEFSPYCRNNNIITDIGKDEYINIMEDVIETVWLNIGCRSEEFEIRSDGDILAMCNQIIHSISLVLMGAGDGKYSKLLSTVTQRSEHVQLNEAMGNNQRRVESVKSKGWMDKIKDFATGR